MITSAACARLRLQPHLQRQRRRLQCRAESVGGGGTPGRPSRDEVMARISKAREYKKTTQGAAPAAPIPQPAAMPQPSKATPAAAGVLFSGTQPTQAAPASVAPFSDGGSDDRVERAFSEGAAQLAAKEEAQFLQAVAAASSSSSTASSSSSGGGSTGAFASPPAVSSSGSQAAGGEAALARIAAARKYGKQQPQQSQEQPEGSSSSDRPSISSAAARPSAASSSAAASSPPAAAAEAPAAAAESEAEQQRSFRTGSGGAEKAANWLQFAESSGGGSQAAQVDPALSAEQFTIAKEEMKKRQEVQIITVDDSYAASVRQEKRAQRAAASGLSVEQQDDKDEQEGEGVHNPAVATWGVFPRPRNISEAYGGGRNLRPGQALESEEATTERQQRVSAALKEYRKSLGLDVEPAVEAAAQASYNEGAALLEQGLLDAALPKFEAAAEAMALRSRLGGEARLQQAICLDSMGRNPEAYEIYVRIENHPAPGVAKKAKRMLFGWKAAETLKAERISYQPTSSAWKRYFDHIQSNSLYNNTYVASADDEAAESGSSGGAVVAVATIVLPLALFAALLLLRSTY